MKPVLKPALRIAILGLIALASLAAAPTQGADATLARDRRPVSLSGSEWWALRPSQVGPAAQEPRRPAAEVSAGTIPEARRHVRVIYPGLIATR